MYSSEYKDQNDVKKKSKCEKTFYFKASQVFRATSRIGTELLYVGSSWSSCPCSSMCRGPQEYITYEYVPTSPAVFYRSGSSNFDSFRDEW